MLIELLVLFIFVLILRNVVTTSHGLPPGDRGFPFIGMLPRNEAELNKIIEKQRTRYGDMFCVQIRCQIVIILTEFKLIKKAFLKSEFSGRLQTFSLRTLDLSSGIVGEGNCDQKLAQEKNVSKHDVLESIIQREIRVMMDEFSKEVGTTINITRRLNVAMLNVIFDLITDDAFQLNGEDVHKFFKNVVTTGKIASNNKALVDLLPWLQKLLPEIQKQKLVPVGDLETTLRRVNSALAKIIRSYKENDFESSITKYNDDVYQSKSEDTDPKVLNITIFVFNLLKTDAETITASIYWFLIYMSFYPEIQREIHQEIDFVVSGERYPLINDKEKMPLLHATFHEVNRCASLNTTGMARLAMEETMFCGYKIPKGSLIYPCLYSCHHDPKYFENPEEFRPSRFLSEDGTLNTNKEGYLPFSIFQGQGNNVGENLAEMKLFLFSAAIMKKFEVSASGIENVSLCDIKNINRSISIVFSNRM